MKILNSLLFATLRNANIKRLPLFKNSKGEPAHSKEDGSDWSPAQWLQAVTGELGEYANIRKKYERGDITHDEFMKAASKELADVVTYIDILAFRLGIDLGQAVTDKFNEVSKRVGCNVFINPDGTGISISNYNTFGKVEVYFEGMTAIIHKGDLASKNLYINFGDFMVYFEKNDDGFFDSIGGNDRYGVPISKSMIGLTLKIGNGHKESQ